MAATGALAAAPVAQAAVMLSGPPGPSPSKSGYVDVNGLHMYYERHGQGGIPLVLLHGGFSAIGTSFGVLLPGLSAKREVIAFELQGHGHTFGSCTIGVARVGGDVGKYSPKSKLRTLNCDASARYTVVFTTSVISRPAAATTLDRFSKALRACSSN